MTSTTPSDELYLGFSSSKGFLARLIDLFTGAGIGGVSHAFLLWNDEHLGWLTLGANDNGLTVVAWDNFVQNHTVAGIFRPRTGFPSLWDGLEVLKSKLNEQYNYPGLVGMSIVEVAAFFHKNVHNPLSVGDKEFCSEFSTEVVRAAGFPILADRLADSISPAEEMRAIDRDSRFVEEPPPIVA